MKTLKVLMIFLLLGTVVGVQAQKKTKIGTIDSQALLQMMPEYDSIQKVYEKEYLKMQKAGQQMYADLQRLQQEYVAQQDSMTAFMKGMKKQEIEDLSNRVQLFEQNAQSQLQNTIQTLQEPIIAKIRQAIKDVATEQGYTQILDSATGALLYFDEAYDVMDLVKQKLNIKAKSVGTPVKVNK